MTDTSPSLPRDTALAALAQKGSLHVATPRPASPSIDSPTQDSSIIIHSEVDTSMESGGGSSFEDVSLGGADVSHRKLLRALSAAENDKPRSASLSVPHPHAENPEDTSSAESGGADSSFEIIGASDTSMTDSPKLGMTSSPRRPRLASLDVDSRPGSTIGPSVAPALSPIPEPGTAVHLNPSASSFEPTGEGEVLTERLKKVDQFSSLVERTKEEWGDLSRAGRKELSSMRLKPIPAMHGPLSLPYARCPSGIDAFLFSADKDEDPWTFVLDGDEPKSGRRPGGSNFRMNPVPLPGNARYSQPGFRQHQLVANSRAGGAPLTASAGRTTTARNTSGMSNPHWGAGVSPMHHDPPHQQQGGPPGLTSTPPRPRKTRQPSGHDDEDISWTQHALEQQQAQQAQQNQALAMQQQQQQAQAQAGAGGAGASFGEGWGYAANLTAYPPQQPPAANLGGFYQNQQNHAAAAQAQAQAANYNAAIQQQVQMGFPVYAGAVGSMGINPAAAAAAAAAAGAAGAGGQGSFPFAGAAAGQQAAAANLIAQAQAANYNNNLVAANNAWATPLLLGLQPNPAFIDPAIIALRGGPTQPATQQQQPTIIAEYNAAETAPSEGEFDDRQSGFSFPDNGGHSRRNSVTARAHDSVDSRARSASLKLRRNSAAPAIPQHGRDSSGGGLYLSGSTGRKPSLSPAVGVAPRRSSIAPKTRLVKDSNLHDSRELGGLGITHNTPVKQQPALVLTEATPAHALGALVPHHSRRSSVTAGGGGSHGGPSLESTLIMAAQVEATNKALSHMLASSLANMVDQPQTTERRASVSGRSARQASSESGGDWGLWGQQAAQQPAERTASAAGHRKQTSSGSRSTGTKENQPQQQQSVAGGKPPVEGLGKGVGRGGGSLKGRGGQRAGGLRATGGSWRANAGANAK